MKFDWRDYWAQYRRGDVRSPGDLFVHVGKTTGGQPLAPALFAQSVEHIARALLLEQPDEVFEWCCGNGLYSAALADRVAHVTATDFSAHLIDEAQRFNGRSNVTYRLADAKEPLDRVLPPERRPTKWLMSAALAYFVPADLGAMLCAALERSPRDPQRLLFTDIPDAGRMGNFYSTEAYLERHEANEREQPNVNEGLGRWWSKGELEDAAGKTGLDVTVFEHPADGSNYRMDALFTTKR